MQLSQKNNGFILTRTPYQSHKKFEKMNHQTFLRKHVWAQFLYKKTCFYFLATIEMLNRRFRCAYENYNMKKEASPKDKRV